MTTKKTTILSLAMAATVALGACAEQGTSPDLVDQVVTMNAALVTADATLEVVALMRGPFGLGLGLGGPQGGTRSVTYYDASGQVHAAYDSLTTASIHVVMDFAGDVERNGWSGTVSRTRDMTVTGLAGREATRTLNGAGSEKIQRSRTLTDGTKTSFDMQGTFKNENLVVPAPGSDRKYPLSGKITRTLSVTVVNGPNGDETRKVESVITFDGDATATAVVNGESYEIDLDARPGAFPLRGGFGFGGGIHRP